VTTTTASNAARLPIVHVAQFDVPLAHPDHA
jgi:hypothetical protein